MCSTRAAHGYHIHSSGTAGRLYYNAFRTCALWVRPVSTYIAMSPATRLQPDVQDDCSPMCRTTVARCAGLLFVPSPSPAVKFHCATFSSTTIYPALTLT